MTTRLTYLLLSVFAFGCTPQSSQPGGSTITLTSPAKLDALISDYVDNGDVPFLYARVEDRNGRVVYEHGAVNDRLLASTVVGGDTWIRIWSMSKAVTISLALDLIEQRKLSFDEPVSKFIPEFASLRVAVTATGESLLDADDPASACSGQTVPVTETMTVRHLINHTAGFYYAITGYPCIDSALTAREVTRATDSDTLVSHLAALPLIQQPGTQYFYGMNTTVLGLVIERATNRNLSDLVAEVLGGQLGIRDLGYHLPTDEPMLPRFSGADGYLREAHPGELDIFGGDVPGYAPGHTLALGGEGMIGTADAYADFLRLLLNDGALNGYRLLDTATIADMVAPHTQLDNDYGNNGYNIWVTSGKLGDGSDGRAGLWVVGGYEGTYGWVDPELGLVGVFVTQVKHASARANGRHDVIREAFYDQILPERR